MVKGYKPAVKSKLRRIIANVEGREKEGKTHFAFSAPGPIAYIDMDMGSEGVVEKFMDEKKIYVASFNYRDVTDQKEWLTMWGGVKAAYLDALASKEVRTVIVDNGTEMWELCRLAGFGKLDHVKAHHYAPVNAEFRDIIRKAYDSDKNVILIHKLKKEYVDDKATGGLERAGFGDVGYLVQVNVRVWRVVKESETEDPKLYFGLTVRDCRQNAAIAGLELVEPNVDFATLGCEVYPQSKLGDWE